MTPCPVCSKPMVVLNPKGYCCECLLKELKGIKVEQPNPYPHPQIVSKRSSYKIQHSDVRHPTDRKQYGMPYQNTKVDGSC